jgi:MarR family transcriptional regulator, organic hydroperoxide resistance regulator
MMDTGVKLKHSSPLFINWTKKSMENSLIPEVQIISDHFNAIRTLLRRGSQADVASSGLTAQQINLLRELSFRNGPTLRELCERMGLAHSTVSGIVDRLEQKQCVERRLDLEDRRYTRIYLSKQITDYINHLRPSQRASLLSGAIEHAQPEEREIIRKGLALLEALIEKELDQDQTVRASDFQTPER